MIKINIATNRHHDSFMENVMVVVVVLDFKKKYSTHQITVYFFDFFPPVVALAGAFAVLVLPLPATLGAGAGVFVLGAAAGLAVGCALTTRGALTDVACWAFNTLTNFCSSIKKALMMRSLKHLWHKTPPNVLDTVFKRLDMRGLSLGRDGVIPLSFSLH